MPSAVVRLPPEQLELRGGLERVELGREGHGRHEDRQPACVLRVQEVSGRDGVGRVRLRVRGCLPGVLCAGEPGPEERDAEVQLHDRPLRMQPRQPVEPVDGAVGPGREGLADARLERPEPGEGAPCFDPLAVGEEPGCAAQRHRLSVVAHAELERERRHAWARLRRRRDRAGRIALERDDADDEGRRRDRGAA